MRCKCGEQDHEAFEVVDRDDNGELVVCLNCGQEQYVANSSAYSAPFWREYFAGLTRQSPAMRHAA